jgi:hypothetical protein
VVNTNTSTALSLSLSLSPSPRNNTFSNIDVTIACDMNITLPPELRVSQERATQQHKKGLREEAG